MASPLARSHIEAKRRLIRLASNGVGGIWRNLGSWDERDIDRWLSRVLPLVNAAQRQSIALTDAYIARATERVPLGLNPDDIIPNVRRGTSMEEAYRRPFVQLWAGLSAGNAFLDANNAARVRAEGMASFDVQGSFRETLVETGRQDDNVWGYQRVANSDACDFCLELNGAQFRTDAPAPIHNFCACGVEPVVYTRGADNRNALDAFNANPTPVPDSVAVHAHGELGPTLADPAHEFDLL